MTTNVVSMNTSSRIITFSLIFVLTVSLAACNLLGTKNSGELTNTGISGTITLGPTSPVAVEGESNSRPHQANINVLDGSQSLVHSFSSDENGVFEVVLEPGNYILMPQVDHEGDIAPSWPRSRPYNVQVNIGSFTEVDIYYDSGIR